MPTTCGFPNCKFRSRYKGFEDNRHFYRVPKKPAVLRDKWLEAIGRTEANIVSQLRICSGHFHGGEKREGDIPVADPAVDPPRRIELPSKGLRLSVTSIGSAVLGREGGSLFRSAIPAAAASHRRGGSFLTYRFRPSSMSLKERGTDSLPPPPPPPPPLLRSIQPPPLLSSEDFAAMSSTITASYAAHEEHWSEMIQICNALLSGTTPTHLFSCHNLPQMTHSFGSLCTRSNTMVIFDRISDYFADRQTLTNNRLQLNDVVVIRKLSEVWLTPEVFRTAVVIIFYDMELYDKYIIRQFTNLHLVVLADVFSTAMDGASDYFRSHGINFRIMQPEPDVDTAADIVFSKILQYNYSTCWGNAPSLLAREDAATPAEKTFSRNLRGRVLGLIGLDPIGLAVARRCSVFGLKVVVHDPTVPEGTCSGLGFAQSERLESLLPLCHFISFHNWKSDTLDNRSYQVNITDRHLSLMRKGASILCLTNRVSFDTAALVRNLGQSHIKNITLTREQIANLMSSRLAVPGDQNGMPNVYEIDLLKLLSEESFFSHRRKVANFVTNSLCDVGKYSLTKSVISPMAKSTSTNKQAHFGSSNLSRPSEQKADINADTSHSDCLEAKRFHPDGVLFSIDTLVDPSSDSRSCAPSP